jgi:hypothetical protein
VRPSHLFIAPERSVDVRRAAEAMGNRQRIDEREIGALSKLRTGAMRCIAHHQHTAAAPWPHDDVAIGRQRELVERGDLVDDRSRRRPCGEYALFQCVETGRFLRVGLRQWQAPEEGNAARFRVRRTSDRQNAHHRMRAVVGLT